MMKKLYKKIEAYISGRKASNKFACKYAYEQLKMHYISLRQISAKIAADDLIVETTNYVEELRRTLDDIRKIEKMISDSDCAKIKF